MSIASEKFLIDSNSFIAPYNTFYSFDFGRAFWNRLQCEIESGNVIVLDIVKDEIACGKNKDGDKDELSEWIENIDDTLILDRIDTAIFEKYTEIINYIQTCQLYKEAALKEWSDIKVADPWLIATASVYEFTVITFEKSNINLSKHTPGRRALIPDVCNAFGVKCNDLYYMMKKLSFVL